MKVGDFKLILQANAAAARQAAQTMRDINNAARLIAESVQRSHRSGEITFRRDLGGVLARIRTDIDDELSLDRGERRRFRSDDRLNRIRRWIGNRIGW